MGVVEGEMYNLAEVDTKELGEAIDMIKDLSEAIYYCTVTKAMEESEKQQHSSQQMYYTPMPDRMYYSGDGRTSSSNGNSSSHNGNESSSSNGRYYTEREYPSMMQRDMKEGRSPQSRRMYMEGKEARMDKTYQMRELEKYVQELTQDIIEMVEDASPEEKQYLSKKISVLANKITQLNDQH